MMVRAHKRIGKDRQKGMDKDVDTLLFVGVPMEERQEISRILADVIALPSGVWSVQQAEEALPLLAEMAVNCIFLDSSLSGSSGESVLAMLGRRYPATPVIMLVEDDTNGLYAIREGAQDYLVRQQQQDDIIKHIVLCAIERHAYQQELVRQQQSSPDMLVETQEQQDQSATLLKQLYEVLNTASSELSRARRIKDDFIIMMSHELRTPLNAILGLSEALQEEVYGSITDKQRSSLANIEQNGRYLLDLINNILDLAKIESGKATLIKDTVQIAPICEGSMRTVAEQAHKKQLEMSLSLDPMVETLEADARRLKQMLVHLLTNAIKFTPDGGKVGVNVTGDPVNNRVVFTVWDTGIGIASADTAYLFQSFVQLGNSLSRRQRGIGIGLVLVARLAEQHGGSINFISEKGKGSQFILTIPWK
jgi:signal transduction histidine kinase